jgi:hypothetical protein
MKRNHRSTDGDVRSHYDEITLIFVEPRNSRKQSPALKAELLE